MHYLFSLYQYSSLTFYMYFLNLKITRRLYIVSSGLRAVTYTIAIINKYPYRVINTLQKICITF